MNATTFTETDLSLRPTFPAPLLEELAERCGTPFYLYDLDHVGGRVRDLAGFDAVRYAQKANTNLALLGRLAREGVRVDAVSGGEAARALAAGFESSRIQATADGIDDDLASAIRAHGLETSVGSLDAVDHAAELGVRRVVLRVNPGFGAGHHARVTTGGTITKHGIWREDLGAAVERARSAGMSVIGLHLHIGSGATQERRDEMICAMGDFVRVVGPTLERVSTGGGLPVPYRPGEAAFDPAPFAAAWRAARERWQDEGWRGERRGAPLEIEVEPGRYLTAHSGVMVTEVLGSNPNPSHDFLLVDAGFNTLARPLLYGSYHHMTVLGREGEPTRPRVVAGPLCETCDLLTQGPDGQAAPRELPDAERGDLLVVHDVGAYGATMASGYNGRPLPAEVVRERDNVSLARAREDIHARIAEERARLGGAPILPVARDS